MSSIVAYWLGTLRIRTSMDEDYTRVLFSDYQQIVVTEIPEFMSFTP